MDVALITCAALPGLHADDRCLLRALRAAGIRAEPVVWEDRYVDWGTVRICLLRSAWDYAFRRAQFLDWAALAAVRSRLWNPGSVVSWNTHKRYLVDLAERGVPVVPTRVLPAGSAVDLEVALRREGWTSGVVKAAVAQSGRYAMRVTPDTLGEGQAHVNRLLPHEDMLLQPYVESVSSLGELSVVMIDGMVTHAVRKYPVDGDFRVHDDYGGSVRSVEPRADEVDVALAAVGAVGQPLLYARVDLVQGDTGDPLVMELEVVEPELFFRFAPAAVERLVAALRRELDRED